MKVLAKQNLCPSLLAATLALTTFAACGDDDTITPAAGSGGATAGKGGTGGNEAGTGGTGMSHTAGHGADAGASDPTGTDSKAADLRVGMDLLLSEHLVLAAKATGAALGGRTDEFGAYGDLLNDNGNALGDMVGAAFGDAAKTTFNGIWSAHNGYFVDYTQAVAANDEAKKTEAVDNLTKKYVPDFAKFLAPATGLDESAIAELTLHHVTMTKAIVDAQAAKDWTLTYKNFREGFAHMQMIGDALSSAIASKKSSDFPGDPMTKAVDLRVGLNEALQEHLYLATFATNAALRSDGSDEFAAAGSALNDNGTDIGAVLGGLYGSEAETTFNGIWSAHNGYFVDYTSAVGAKDDTKKAAAVDNLTLKYVPMFAAFLHGATDLPEATLADLTAHHVTTTAAVVDAQAANTPGDAAKADLSAGQHMQMLADPLSAAIVAKLPSKF